MEKKDIARVLKAKRSETGLSVKDVIDRLKGKGIQVSDKTVYGWESGHRQPDSDILLELCSIYGIKSFNEFTDNGEAALSVDEKMILENYRSLSVAGRNLINETLNNLVGYEEIIKVSAAQEEHAVTRETIRVYDAKAAAGLPLPIVTDGFTMVTDATVPKNANFGIILAGDSMEPDYPDGCTVWVRSQPDLENGDIGIFTINGEAVCKKLYREGGACRLISLNPKYAPIEPTEDMDMRTYGKVIGRD